MSDDVLTTADLPTLRRMAAHFRARAPHRRLHGRIVCHALAAICDQTTRVIAQYGEVRPEVDYGQRGRRER